MVEKGVPLARGRSGGVADSSGGQKSPSAVATEAAEHPQNVREYEKDLRRLIKKQTTVEARIFLEIKKRSRQRKIASLYGEIMVLNKLLEELEKC